MLCGRTAHSAYCSDLYRVREKGCIYSSENGFRLRSFCEALSQEENERPGRALGGPLTVLVAQSLGLRPGNAQ